MDNIRKILEAVAKEHPYKIPSRRETYDKYNEGWTDAVNRIESMLPEQTETQCYLGSPCEYQNPDVEIAQLSQEGTTKDATSSTCSTACSTASSTTDTISRQAAIDEIKALYEWHDTVTEDRVVDHIKRLPPAQPETCEGCKHLGKWENEVEYGYPSPCTRCKRKVEDHYER